MITISVHSRINHLFKKMNLTRNTYLWYILSKVYIINNTVLFIQNYSYRIFFLPFSSYVLLRISSQNLGWTLSVGRRRLCGPCGIDPSTRGGRRPTSGGTTAGNSLNVSSKAWLILPSSSNLEQQNVRYIVRRRWPRLILNDLCRVNKMKNLLLNRCQIRSISIAIQ